MLEETAKARHEDDEGLLTVRVYGVGWFSAISLRQRSSNLVSLDICAAVGVDREWRCFWSRGIEGCRNCMAAGEVGQGLTLCDSACTMVGFC